MLDFFVGFAVAVLSGLGIGGGGLLVIYLVLANGMEQLPSQAANLIFFLFSSTAAMLVHLTKRQLNWQLIVFFTVFGIGGALIGSALAGSVPPDTVRTAFGWLLLTSGVLTLVRR